MRRGFSTPLVIAIMAFAVVSFLFLIDTAMNPDGSKKITNTSTVNGNTNAVACPADAKLCSDGSYVSRTGPSCKFAECPTTNTNSVNETSNANVDGHANENINTILEEPAQPPIEDSVLNEKWDKIKKVRDIQELFPGLGSYSASAVDVMGEEALIGGNAVLYWYDGNKVIDITSHLVSTDPQVNSKPIVISDIANNGDYWLINVIRVGEQDHLYSFDGARWEDLTAQRRAAAPKTVFGYGLMTWNGTYWLLGDNPGHLVKYDGTTFTDIFSQIPNVGGSVTFMDIEWNGHYFLMTMLGYANHGRLFRYDGVVVREIELDSGNNVTTVGWNGTYWLVAGFNGQQFLKYDGESIIGLNGSTRQQATIAWLKKSWLVGPNFYDGEAIEPTTPFNVAYRVYDVSVGTLYGLLAGDNGTVYRFDFIK